MDGSAKKQALLALHKKLQEHIAGLTADDPDAAEEGQESADEAMAEASPGGFQGEKEPAEVHMKFAEYLKPHVKKRRPGTGMMMAATTKSPMGASSEKKSFGRYKKEAV